MIKVLLNGTPVYRLVFERKKYKTVRRKKLTLGEVLLAIKDKNHYAEGDWEAVNENIAETLTAAYGGVPLYETTAHIYLEGAKKGEPPVASATSRQSPKDDNRRETGRQVALGRLLRDNNNPPFTPFERLAIQKAYDDRKKTSRGPKPTPPTGSGAPAQLAVPARQTAHILPFDRPRAYHMAA